MLKHFGLAHRLLIGWLCQTLLIVVLFSFAMHESTEFMERNLISNILEEETLVLIEEIQSGEKIQIPSSISFYGDREGLTRIPVRFQQLPDGYNEIVQPGESYLLFVTQPMTDIIIFCVGTNSHLSKVNKFSKR